MITAPLSGRDGRAVSLSLVFLLLGILALMTVASPTVAVAAPAAAWRITQGTEPTMLVPGSSVPPTGAEGSYAAPKFHLTVANVGGTSAEAVTVTDTLPAGVSPAVNASPTYKLESGHDEPCSVIMQVVTCSIGEAVRPGATVNVFLPVDVDAGASGTISNAVTVASSAAPSVTKAFSAPVGIGVSPFEFLPGSYGLSASAFDEAGDTPVAGAHPFSVEVVGHLPATMIGTGNYQEIRPVDPPRSLTFELPKGIIVNPLATSVRCTSEQLEGSGRIPQIGCPAASQVGRVYYDILGGLEGLYSPLYNMVPAFGAPAELAFSVSTAKVHIRGAVNGAFHLTAESSEILAKFPIAGVRAELWGDPSDSRHDYARRGKSNDEECEAGCAIEPSPASFLTMPTSCTEPTVLAGSAVGWLGSNTHATAQMTNRESGPLAVGDCGALRFSPTITSTPTTDHADSPSGLDFGMHQLQDESLGGRATAALKDARVTLPDGMVVNPAAGDGLGACTEAQVGYAPEEGKVRFATTPQSCPDASKVGTIEVRTPLLEQKLTGAVYLAKPFDNPFGSLIALYLAIEDEETGIIAKLAGTVEPDPHTGRLTATFMENPELPIEDIALHFFAGSRASLTSPFTCGSKQTTANLTPWSTPAGPDAVQTDSFQTSVAAAGSGSCPGSEGQAPADASFSAGTASPIAGSFSPFSLRLARADGTQHITGVSTTLPEGLLGRLAGIPYCSENAISLAESRGKPEQGRVEQASPSCPLASEVGTVRVGAGSGPSPLFVTGHVYLAGPYKDAPLSLVIITPAVAGPFDLGVVTTRVALELDPFSAQIHAVSDPLPTVLDGIPLDIRSVELTLDRPDFTLNPTSCEVKEIGGSFTTQAGQTAPLQNRFQVGDCSSLKFQPRLKLRLRGKTKRSGHPALKAVVTYPKKGTYANIARAQVGLPHSEFLDQGNIGTVCTQAQLKSASCPKKAIYGRAKAWTPLLDKPLEGPVYLGVGFGHKLPDIVADLNGQVRILLHGRVDTTKHKGIRNTFEVVPDAPVSRFVLELKGGKKFGLLENSEDICRKPQRASARFIAQSGRVAQLRPKIANSCKNTKRKKKHQTHNR